MNAISKVTGLLGLVVCAVGWVGSAFGAAAYPSKNIMVVVPFPAGGRSDITMRLLAPYLERSLGHSVVILNRPGGGSSIGFRYLAQSQADGYTIGLNTNAVITAQYTVKENLDLRNYHAIALINSDPAVLAAGYGGLSKDIDSMIKFARGNPKKLLVGINPGASAHIFAAAFAKAAKIDVTFVPYKGGSERVAALAGGHINADFGVLAQYRSMMTVKRVRILGVASSTRLQGYPDIPTFKESGVNLEISGWQGFFAPRGVPPVILRQIVETVRKVLTDPEVVEKLAKIDIQVSYMPPNQFEGFLKKDDAAMRELIRDLGLMVTAPK